MITFRRLRLAVSVSLAAAAAGSWGLSGPRGGAVFAAVPAPGKPRATTRAVVLSNPGPAFVPDEVIVHVAPGTTAASVQQFAAAAGCTVLRAVAYVPNFYVLQLNGGGAGSSNETQSVRSRAVASTPSPALTTAIGTLSATAGVLSATVNHLSYPSGVVQSAPSLLPVGPSLPSSSGGSAARAKTAVAVPGRAVLPTSGQRVNFPPSTNVFLPNDTYFQQGQQWDMSMIRMPEAWAIQLGSGELPVGVVDSGIYSAHPEFTRPNGTPIILAGENFAANTTTATTIDPTNYQDTFGHGTHVAGTIAAATNNAQGIASVGGLNANGVDVRLIIARVFPTVAAPQPGGVATEPLATDDAVASGVGYVVAQGAKVVNMSLGLNTSLADFQLSAEYAAISAALAQGVIVVASAGNNSSDNSINPQFPGDLPGVFEVGAVDDAGVLSQFSDFGGNVAIVAPGGDGFTDGTNILSTWPPTVTYDFNYEPPIGGGLYAAIAGTSMAAPHVAGACALLLSEGVPSSEVQFVLERTAEEPTNATYDPHVYGAGILDVYSGLELLQNTIVLSLLGPQNLGTTYEPQIQIQISALVTDPGFDQTQVTLEERAATLTSGTIDPNDPIDSGDLLKVYQGGTDFTIPIQPISANINYATVNVLASLSGSPSDTYKFVLKYKGNVVGGPQFVQVETQTEHEGLQMFSLPFLALTGSPTSPEQATFGVNPSSGGSNPPFLLIRYDPVAGGYDYFPSAPGATAGATSTNDPLLASFAAYDPAASSEEENATDATTGVRVNPVGLGYWLFTPGTQNAYPGLGVAPVGPEVSDPVAINLGIPTGSWYMIGDPFTFVVDWETAQVTYTGTAFTVNGQDVLPGSNYTITQAVALGIIQPYLVGWDGTDYVYNLLPAGELQPFDGYWIQANLPCQLIIPAINSGIGVTGQVAVPTATAVAAANARVAAAARAATALTAATPPGGGWQIRFGASVQGSVDGRNYFGESVSATSRDIAKPPATGGHVYVRFLQSAGSKSAKSAGPPLAFDIRSVASVAGSPARQTWTAEVTATQSNVPVTVSWSQMSALPRLAQLTLTDTATGKVVSMHARSSYSFTSGAAGSSRLFTITLTPQRSAGSLAITGIGVTQMSGGAGARVQGAGMWAVRFTVNQADAEVTGVVRSLSGRVLATMAVDPSASGGASRTAVGPAVTTMYWNGEGVNGAALPIGSYMLEITAQDAEGNVVVERRPILIVR